MKFGKFANICAIRNLLFVFLLVINLFATTDKNSPSTKKIYKKGVLLYKNKQYKQAMDCFMQIIIREPKNERARYYIKECAREILKPKIEAINRQREAMVFDARKYVFEKHKQYDIEGLYKEALRSYKKKRYLKAGDLLRQVLKITPDYKDADKYFSIIESKMYKNSDITSGADAATLAYANGYINWWDNKVRKAMNEWEKFIALKPKNTEVPEYMKKAKKILEMQAQKEYQEKVLKEIKETFRRGENKLKAKDYVSAIKVFEKVIRICNEKPILESDDWKAKSQKKIEQCLEELKKLTLATKKKKKKVKEKKEIIDAQAAQRHYTAGLVSYAQGRLREAIREWDLALRLNPYHEKARLAKERAEKELCLEK